MVFAVNGCGRNGRTAVVAESSPGLIIGETGGAGVSDGSALIMDGGPAVKAGDESVYEMPHVSGELLIQVTSEAAAVLNRTRCADRGIDITVVSELPELDSAFLALDADSIWSGFSGRLVRGLDRFFQITYRSSHTTREAALRLAECGCVITARPNGSDGERPGRLRRRRAGGVELLHR
jgi:hypothetical protein